ncbi:MAG: type II toxin-antitoxin system RelE/ParE family toxin [Endomicrobium sp.]|jgi:putative addiction module killer protein|nr:type II toxin-antitoxin system RelE/ParE family toxin [Endomicrobium sp.]
MILYIEREKRMLIDRKTRIFEEWFLYLPENVKKIVGTYINRVKQGNFSNCKSVGGGIYEIKVNYQKGYRVYYMLLENKTILLLLIGGNKKSQNKDINLAIKLNELLKAKEEI